jgi:hypothetical protein
MKTFFVSAGLENVFLLSISIFVVSAPPYLIDEADAVSTIDIRLFYS